ncbi:MAG: 2-oxoglutarate synthase [Acidimicrobiia bacterium]|nr:2-oxoglutarate synthase [Acidimicrobiia bacterium]
MTTVLRLDTYRNDSGYPFCPGCGHGSILDSLNQALVTLQLNPAQVVIVSDIGCAGLSDQHFETSAFHGLHGRSVTYATGVKLARPDLTVIVIMGDGGTGIGGTHLINAARRNVGVTVLVMNNLNFGMTGGQHSTTTPEGAVTSTTPQGSLEHPLDICGTVDVNGAGYVYRGTSFDPDLADRMVDAIRHPGFALLDIWELCTAYFVPKNRLGKKGLDSLIDDHGYERGVIADRDVAGYERLYRDQAANLPPRRPARTIPVEFESSIAHPISVLVAGSAGAKVRSATRLGAEAAIRSGLWARQRGDYPVTVKTGHSVNQLVIAPTEQPALPVSVPDVLVLLSADGLRKVGGALESMTPQSVVVTVPDFSNVETRARVVVVDPAGTGDRIPKAHHGLVVLTVALTRLGIPADALRAAARGPFEEENLEAIEAGAVLAQNS